MTADARWSLLTRLLQSFLDSAQESQVVILEDGDAVDEYIQFKRTTRSSMAKLARANGMSPTSDGRSTRRHASGLPGSGSRMGDLSATTSATTSPGPRRTSQISF
jgi:hypothetical protein